VPGGLAGALPDGQVVEYGLRPEYTDLSLSARDDAFAGKVSVVENLGTSFLVTLDVTHEGADHTVQAVVPEGEEPAPGTAAWAVPRPGRALVYRDGDLLRPAAPAADGKDGQR
jgi:multiple sugar transport system ATP-binding protein